jgi:hypothetical protein
LIWVKRLSPFVLLVLIWFGYHFGRDYLANRRAAEQDRLALVTAQVWVATAVYRDDPERYTAYRDSLLAANHIEREDMFEFLKRFESKPEKYLPFTQKVQDDVDSLARIADSLSRDKKIQAADSLKAADRR